MALPPLTSVAALDLRVYNRARSAPLELLTFN